MNPRPFRERFRQRLPFLPPLLAAVAGIAVSPLLPVWSWMAAFAFSGFLFFLRKGFGCFLAVFVSAFGLIQAWQGWHSPAAQFAGLRNFPVSATVRGVVLTPPRVFSKGSSSWEMEVSEGSFSEGVPIPHIRLLVSGQGTPPAAGDAVEVRGQMAPLDPPRNPGQFDFAGWCARKGIPLCLNVAHPGDLQVLAPGQGSRFRAWAGRARNWMSSTLTTQINDPLVAELLLGMVIGDTPDLPATVKDEFRATGTFHLFSVSGLHVGMLACLLWYLFKSIQLPRPAAALLIIPLLFFYAFMTGAQPASMRAAIMAAIVLLGFLADRKPVLLNNLCAAALGILAFDSNQLFQAGFQLSFCVVASIFLLERPLTSLLRRPFLPDPFLPRKLIPAWQNHALTGGQKFAGLAGVSLAAWMGSLPLTLGYFQFVSFSALPCNLLAVPLSFAIMAVAMLSLLTGPWLAAVFNQTNWALCHLLLGVVHQFASLPGSFFYVGVPSWPQPEAEVVVFDCGSGGAISIATRNSHWLIDCGSRRFPDSTLLPYLRSRGCTSLTGLILSHGDGAHTGGAHGLIERLRTGTIIDTPLADRSAYRRLLHRELAQAGRPKSLCRHGDRISLEPGVSLYVLFPPAGLERELADDQTFVLRLDVGTTRILFLSDAGLFTEEWLIQHARESLPCEILVRNFPGRGPWGAPEFLRAAAPRVLVLGGDRSPDVPSFSLTSPESTGASVFRQELTGAVTIRIFSHSGEISAFLGGHTFQFSR